MTRPRIYLSLDVSSTLTGYAVMAAGERLIEAGVLRPDSPRAPALERMQDMKRDLRELLEKFRPDDIVLEMTSGKTSKKHKGKGAGLSIYGVAIGKLWEVCEAWAEGRPSRVRCVLENEWTRQIGKGARAAVIAAMFPRYDPGKDGGMDIADAIGLNLFVQRQDRAKAGFA